LRRKPFYLQVAVAPDKNFDAPTAPFLIYSIAI
jgi:hypothetical protein